MGLVRQQAKHQTWKVLLLSLALSRTLKCMLAARMRHTLRSERTSDMACRELIAGIFIPIAIYLCLFLFYFSIIFIYFIFKFVFISFMLTIICVFNIGFFNMLLNHIVPTYLLGDEAAVHSSEPPEKRGMSGVVDFVERFSLSFLSVLSCNMFFFPPYLGFGYDCPSEEVPWHPHRRGEGIFGFRFLSSLDIYASCHNRSLGLSTNIQIAYRRESPNCVPLQTSYPRIHPRRL